MSAPAAKAFSLPVSTMAPMEGSASKALRAAFSSAINGVKRALRALGRWSWTCEGFSKLYLSGSYGEWEGSILMPTPVRGVETLRNSYCLSVAVDIRRARRGMMNLPN
jgi:hypothetical protein